MISGLEAGVTFIAAKVTCDLISQKVVRDKKECKKICVLISREVLDEEDVGAHYEEERSGPITLEQGPEHDSPVVWSE
jgi:hypothetical protein